MFAAQSGQFHSKLQNWMNRLAWAVMQPDPPVPPAKIFKPKHQLPVLADYTADPGPTFWEKFPSNLTRVGKSTICADKLRNLAWTVGYNQTELLEKVCKDLSDGADIGCKGEARNPSFSSNAPSAFDFKEQVTDAIADWVASGFASGPFPPSQRPPNA